MNLAREKADNDRKKMQQEDKEAAKK